MSAYWLLATVRVLSKAELNDEYGALCPQGRATEPDQQLDDIFFDQAFVPPGTEIVRHDVGYLPIVDAYALVALVEISDPDALNQYAIERYRACWFDDDWRPADSAEALVEALITSNQNPSPDEIGINLISYNAHQAAPETI